MSKLTEQREFRDRVRVFEDRHEAGKMLAKALGSHEGTNSMVFAIPSGGVPVAVEVAAALNLPLDLLIVRKVQIPFNPEAGFGALNPEGEAIYNEELLRQLRLPDAEISIQKKKTLELIQKRNELFRAGRPYPPMEDKAVILTDDGLASGYTMLAAVRFVKKRMPKSIVVAVPTGSKRTVDVLLPEVDELYCLNVRSGYPFAVADAYRNWYDLTDSEVLELIKGHLS